MAYTLLAAAMEKMYNEVVEQSKTKLPEWFTKENGQKEFLVSDEYVTMSFPDLELVSDFLNKLEIIPIQVYGTRLMKVSEMLKMLDLFGRDEQHFLRGVLYTLHFFTPGGNIAQLSMGITSNIELWRRDLSTL